jgi:hypothetical protein
VMFVAADSLPVELSLIMVLTVPSLDRADWLRRAGFFCEFSWWSNIEEGRL